jgi:hypothetical protein
MFIMCNIFDNEPCRNVDQTYSTDIDLISDALDNRWNNTNLNFNTQIQSATVYSHTLVSQFEFQLKKAICIISNAQLGKSAKKWNVDKFSLNLFD